MKTPELACFVCSHVFRAERPILLVCLTDGEWQCLCGGNHPDDEEPHVVGLNHLIERDSSLTEVLDLEEGWEAERNGPNDVWTKRKIE